jgi:hypothetical protein
MAEPKSKMAYEPRININLKEFEEANLTQERASQNRLTQCYRIIMMFLVALFAVLQWIFPFFNLGSLPPEALVHSAPDLRTTKKPNFIFIMTGMFIRVLDLSNTYTLLPRR